MTTKTAPSELQTLFNIAAENAAKIFKADGGLAPLWHVVDGNDEHVVISTPWTNEDEKVATVQALRLLFRAQRVKRLVFMVEAWTVQAPQGTSLRDAQNIRASTHEDRREVLMISAEDRDGNRISGNYYILRPEHGPATLSLLHRDEYDMSSGRFTGMLS